MRLLSILVVGITLAAASIAAAGELTITRSDAPEQRLDRVDSVTADSVIGTHDEHRVAIALQHITGVRGGTRVLAEPGAWLGAALSTGAGIYVLSDVRELYVHGGLIVGGLAVLALVGYTIGGAIGSILSPRNVTTFTPDADNDEKAAAIRSLAAD